MRIALLAGIAAVLAFGLQSCGVEPEPALDEQDIELTAIEPADEPTSSRPDLEIAAEACENGDTKTEFRKVRIGCCFFGVGLFREESRSCTCRSARFTCGSWSSTGSLSCKDVTNACLM